MRRLMIAALVVSCLGPGQLFPRRGLRQGTQCRGPCRPVTPVAVRRRPGTRVAAADHGAARTVRGLREAHPRLLAERRIPAARLVPGQGLEKFTVRDTGPFKGVYYGTHPAVRIYYSPRAMQWLIEGRQGPIPDGAMIIKEQYHPPAARYSGLTDEQLPKVSRLDGHDQGCLGREGRLVLGRILRRDDVRRRQAAVSIPVGGVRVVLPALPRDGGEGADVLLARNIQGFPGQPIAFPDDGSWRLAPGADPAHAKLVRPRLCKPARQADRDFLQTFTSIPGVVLETSKKCRRRPTTTWSRRPRAGQYISSSQCMSCHGGLNGPFGPTMFLPSPSAPLGTVAGANVSPYGEWRWSPMGLAGRDPIFFAQLESELAYLDTLPPPQNAEEHETDERLPELSRRDGQAAARHRHAGKGDFKLDFLQLTDRSNPDFLYGALARDGISCAVCHRIVPDNPPPGVTPLEHFLKNSITGRFHVESAGHDLRSLPGQRNRALHDGQRDRDQAEVQRVHQSSRMCGSCHTIDLPVVDGKPGQTSLEQVTYLEWLNSQYQNEFGPPGPNARTCQDCHMPGTITARRSASTSIDSCRRSPSSRTRITRRPSTAPRKRAHDRRARRLQAPRVPGHERLPAGDVQAVQRDSRRAQDRLHERLQHGSAGRHRQHRAAGQERTAKCAFRRDRAAEIEAQVAITNLAGHRFPSGVGFRRAFIELLVLEDGEAVGNGGLGFGSNQRLGVIVDGNGKVLPTEFFTDYTDAEGRRQQHFQPHHQVITSQDQVQIYEELTKNADGGSRPASSAATRRSRTTGCCRSAGPSTVRTLRSTAGIWNPRMRLASRAIRIT